MSENKEVKTIDNAIKIENDVMEGYTGHIGETCNGVNVSRIILTMEFFSLILFSLFKY